MNLPNKLTVFRVVLIIPFVAFLLGGYEGWSWFTMLFGGILAYTDHATVRCNKNSKIAEYCSVNEIAVSIID